MTTEVGQECRRGFWKLGEIERLFNGRVGEGREPSPPSSNRTGGFPASGLPENFSRRHAQELNNTPFTESADPLSANGHKTKFLPAAGRDVDYDVSDDESIALPQTSSAHETPVEDSRDENSSPNSAAIG